MSRHRNPEFFGEDLEDLAGKAVGIAAVSFINKQFARPLADQVIKVSGAAAKLLDVASTTVSALVLGEVAGMAHARIGRDLRTGGLLLATGKLIAVPVQGFEVDGKLPTWLTSRLSFGAGAAAAPALPGAATQAALPAGAASALPIGQATTGVYGATGTRKTGL